MTAEQAAKKWEEEFHADCVAAGASLDPRDNETRWDSLGNGKYQKELYVAIDGCWVQIGPIVDADYEVD
jgi:hypothetical protein